MSQRINQYSPENLSGVLWAYAIHEAYPGPIAMDAAVSFICKNLQVRHCRLSAHHPRTALLPSPATSGLPDSHLDAAICDKCLLQLWLMWPCADVIIVPVYAAAFLTIAACLAEF